MEGWTENETYSKFRINVLGKLLPQCVTIVKCCFKLSGYILGGCKSKWIDLLQKTVFLHITFTNAGKIQCDPRRSDLKIY